MSTSQSDVMQAKQAYAARGPGSIEGPQNS